MKSPYLLGGKSPVGPPNDLVYNKNYKLRQGNLYRELAPFYVAS